MQKGSSFLDILLMIIYRIFVNAIGLGIASLIFMHVQIASFPSVIITALVLSAVNFFIKPVLLLLSLPLIVLSFGFFYIIINGLVIMLVSWFVPGFAVDGLWAAIGVSIIVGLTNLIFDMAYDRNSNIVKK